jgi:hypothetical protein
MVKVFICCNNLAFVRIASHQPGVFSIKVSLSSITSKGAVDASRDPDVSGTRWTAFIALTNYTTDLLKTGSALIHFEFK